jgi:hypothetical protein
VDSTPKKMAVEPPHYSPVSDEEEETYQEVKDPVMTQHGPGRAAETTPGEGYPESLEANQGSPGGAWTHAQGPPGPPWSAPLTGYPTWGGQWTPTPYESWEQWRMRADRTLMDVQTRLQWMEQAHPQQWGANPLPGAAVIRQAFAENWP